MKREEILQAPPPRGAPVALATKSRRGFHQQDVAPNPQLLLRKLRDLHTEAHRVYGVDLFTAFLGEGGTKIETVVNSQDAAIAKIMMDGPAKECQLAALDSLLQRMPRSMHKQHPDTSLRQEYQEPPNPLVDYGLSVERPQEEVVVQAEEDEPTQAAQPKRTDEPPPGEALVSAGEEGSQIADTAGEQEPQEGGGVDGPLPAPPGLGAAALWAREAASLKRKMGGRETPEDIVEAEALSTRAKRFVYANPMPNTNKELAILIRDVIGARPKYGDESARPTCWPADVPWLKGKSISQMNNVTLRRLAQAVLQHQARARERARASGIVVPVGVLGCAQRTKKELSALIRSKLGLRLQYGVSMKRPLFWPEDVPWVKGKPLSMMNHAQLSSIFAAMVGVGLCPAGACLEGGIEDGAESEEPSEADYSGSPSAGAVSADEDDKRAAGEFTLDDDTTVEDDSDADRENGSVNERAGGHAKRGGNGFPDGGNGRPIERRGGGSGGGGDHNGGGCSGDAPVATVPMSHMTKQEARPFEMPCEMTQGIPAQHLFMRDAMTNHFPSPPPMMGGDGGGEEPHAGSRRNKSPVTHGHLHPAAMNEVASATGGGGTGNMPVAGTLLPSFPSLASLASLPLTASSEEELNALGPSSSSAFEDAVIGSCSIDSEEGTSVFASLLGTGATGRASCDEMSVRGYAESCGGYVGGNGGGMGDGGGIAAGGGACHQYASLEGWVVGDGL